MEKEGARARRNPTVEVKFGRTTLADMRGIDHERVSIDFVVATARVGITVDREPGVRKRVIANNATAINSVVDYLAYIL